MTRQIIITVIGSVIVGILGFGGNQALAWWKRPSESAVRSKVCAKLECYSNGINNRKFDAHEIFAASVERFILMKNTTPQKINDYVNRRYYEDFQNPKIAFELGSLTIKEFGEEGALVEVVEHDSFYKKATERNEHIRNPRSSRF